MSNTNLKQKLTNIADAIKEKRKISYNMYLKDMPAEIKRISGEIGDLEVALIERTIRELPLDLLNGYTTIGNYAFYDCYFSKIYLPATITSIGDYAFYTTNYSKPNVYVYADIPPTLGVNVFLNATIHVKASVLSQYQQQWSDYASDIRGDL